MNEDHRLKVTLELTAERDDHMQLARQLLNEAMVAGTLPGKHSPDSDGHSDARILRRMFPTVAAAHEACRLLPPEVDRSICVDVRLTEDDLVVIFSAHSKVLLILDWIFEQGHDCERCRAEWRYHVNCVEEP